ncbi:MAG TPA: biotin carboxylase N-terminal domain-containing protein, partial [Alphaproteobacteria bacterium]|nr:biotin carboxylase N-terminal domain-containing protein [Alphaproteobacteria bacterium]
MFQKVLIANRGEIACRIIETARKLNIKTVAVYSDADKNAKHVQMADFAYWVGETPARQSYLNIDNIINVLLKSAAEAVHPGYGFLSENASFAKAVLDAKRIFIGPPPSAIQAMGSKIEAKRLMEKAGVPILPGHHRVDQQDDKVLLAAAEKIGFPVLIKAAAGGGGKGMRRVDQATDFLSALASARREAKAAFGDDAVLVEKYLLSPRHIEIQVFADQQGNAVHLFERECSIQRRHQKVLEEAPSVLVTPKLRQEMGQVAINAAKAVGYQGAGTVEFIVDQQGRFYFMEMNTRLQVEHRVTEKITGQDLVEWQFLVAAGYQLPLNQSQLSINGHSIQARVYAEDPDRDFLPSSGEVRFLKLPNHVH